MASVKYVNIPAIPNFANLIVYPVPQGVIVLSMHSFDSRAEVAFTSSMFVLPNLAHLTKVLVLSCWLIMSTA
jgi:hypothetical protein